MSEKKLCSLCLTIECSDNEPNGTNQLKSKQEIGILSHLPNEVIGLILTQLTLKDLSRLTLVNKWIRDFIYTYFFESRKGLKALLGHHLEATNAVTPDLQKQRILKFRELGLLLKRMTCLLPTADRLEILSSVFYRIDGIPKPSSIASDNHSMRFTFQCYGRLIHRFVAGWDDSELKSVFKTIQNITNIEAHIETIVKHPVGVRQPVEYYVRTFFRMVCLDPSAEGDNKNAYDSCFWLNRTLKRRSQEDRAKLMTIIYGPLISTSPTHLTTPYIGWWDLTDTFFVENGLSELGLTLYVLYNSRKKDVERKGVIQLMEMIIRTPENWLMENVAALLYHAGDDLTFDYLYNKLNAGKYAEVAQKLVFLSVVAFKLEKETKIVYKMIEKLTKNCQKVSLYNELPIAFSEAITEAENALELEEERDVSEVHDIVDANNDLLKFYMIRPSPESSQSSVSEDKCSQYSRNGADEQNEE